MATVLNPAIQPAPTAKLQIAGELVAVLTLFGAALAVLPLSRVLQGGVAEHVLMLGRMVGLLALVTWLMRRSGRTWADVGLKRPSSWWRVAGLVVGGYIFFALVTQVVLPLLLAAAGARPPALQLFGELRGDLLQYLFFAIPVSWGTAAFIEEMFARGYLLNRIVDLTGSDGSAAWRTAAAAQGLLFGLGHAYQGAGGVIVTATVGLAFGLVYLLGKRNLWACIILHGIVDCISVTAFYLGWIG